MLQRYILRLYIKAFGLSSAVLLGTGVLYLTFETLLVFRQKSLEIFFRYILLSTPLAFLYLSPIVSWIALTVLIRFFIQRQLDRLIVSFGVPPIHLVRPVILFSLVLSILHIYMSFQIYPSFQRSLYTIEKEYKKGKKDTLLIKDQWFALKDGEKVVYSHIGLADVSKGTAYDVFLLYTKEGSIEATLRASKAFWKGNSLFIPDAYYEDLEKGGKFYGPMEVSFLSLSNIRPLASKLEHITFTELISVYGMAERLGINRYAYLAEILRRLQLSLMPLLMVTIVARALLKRGSLVEGSLYGGFSLALHILSLNLIKITAEEIGVNPLWGLLPSFCLLIMVLRSLYDLEKGFGV